jgi:DNA helicase-2/ATP-dependent DNA helicase PcrA
MTEDYLKDLNGEQCEAVRATEGPLLIIAGAGAGKTKTITYRILHLIKKGVAPEEILAITFTNKAAKEKRERTLALLAKNRDLNLPVSFSSRPFVSTFHALGVHILKENAALLGIPRHFTIFDKSDGKRAIKDALEAMSLDPKQYEPGKIQSVISREKGNFVTSEEYAERAGNDFFSNIVSKAWQHYEKALRAEKALDFDDLLLKTALLLKNKPEALEHYQDIWKYIHIDEYQDTNRVQYMIAKLLSEKHKNICVVGDSDQNIYSWRGAQIRNILNFERDFPGAQTVLLERNYRSTKTILAAANTIIKKNKFRNEKSLFTDNPDGEKITCYEAYDEQDEARFVARKAKEIVAAGTDPSQIAVLYRANYQSRALEEAFLGGDIPYQVLGIRFFERKEVKDALSYIKAALNPDNISDLKRIINVPTRGIGKVTLLKVLANQKESLAGTARASVEKFFILLARIKETALHEKPSDLVRFVIREAGFEDSWRNGTDEDKERLENVRELVSLAAKYDEFTPEEGLEKFLTDAALASDQDELSETKQGVKLMTVHASKGLEFDCVFITGLEHGLFPSSRSETEAPTEESEEERRLFYVALTRARTKVFLVHAQIRTIYGSKQVNMPSVFLSEIDEDLCESDQGIPDAGDSRADAIRRIFSIDF